MRRTSLALALVLPLVLTGCTSSHDEPQAQPSATFDLPTESPTPSPTPSPSATPSPTPSATPTAARRIPAADRDVDGDGKPDTMRATAELLTVELSSTGRTVSAPIHSESPRSAPILGTADVDRDGFAEVFVLTAEGASTQFATPYRFDGKALHEIQLEGGPARLGMGGSVTHGEGFRCTSTGRLEVLNADSQDGTTYTVHVLTYRIGVDELDLVSQRTSTAKQGDALLEASYQPNCGSVENG